MLLIATGAAKAQSNESAGASQTSNLALADAISISFVTPGSVTMAFSSVNDFANGIESDNHTLLVLSNKKFNITAKPLTSKFTYTGPSANPNMSVSSVLKIKVTANNTGGSIGTGFTSYKSMSTSGTGSKIISNGTPGGNNTFSIKYQAKPGFTYPGGTYTVDIVYTATQA